MIFRERVRVSKYAEVFTADKEVNAMLDFFNHETDRIESSFLEPACGNGNFLAEIFRRKLKVVENRYRKSQLEFERFSILAASSLYGIDILEDNVLECRDRLASIFSDVYSHTFQQFCKQDCISSIQYIFEKNIVWGNAISLGTDELSSNPLVFSEWKLVSGSMVSRRDFTLSSLLSSQEDNEGTVTSDLGKKSFIPQPVKEYPLTHFLELAIYA